MGIKEKGKITLDPACFQVEYLDKLYRNTSNPLWIVLKSTMPVSDQFTAIDKIKAYQEVAQAFKDKKLGNTEKYSGALKLAGAAASIVKAHPEAKEIFQKAFGQESDIGKWILGKVKNKAAVLKILDLSAVSREPDLVKNETSTEPGNENPTKNTSVKTWIRQLELAKFVDKLELTDKEKGYFLTKIEAAKDAESLSTVEQMIQEATGQKIKTGADAKDLNDASGKQLKQLKAALAAGRENMDDKDALDNVNQSEQPKLRRP